MTGREALIRTVKETGSLPGLPDGHFIDGRFRPSVSGDRMESFDPGRGVAFASFAAGSAADVDLAVAAAGRALVGPWRSVDPASRGRILQRAAERLRADADRFALAECLDVGKRLVEAEGDVGGAARAFEYYAGAADKLEGRSIPVGPDYHAYTLLEPIGVVAVVVPWNYPLSTLARAVAPALAAGCTIVAKPAEQTPFTALMLAELLVEAGLPAGVFNVVTGLGSAVGAPLVGHPGIDHVTFTGSVGTGISVMAAAAANVTHVTLELGGKSPLVVLDDADLDAALDGVMGAIYENAGQICSAGSRLVLQRGIRDAFLERLVPRAAALVLGHGLDDADVGPVISPQQLARIDGHVAGARARGARLLAGGGPAQREGWFYQPTVIEAATADDPIVRDEIFGPVLVVETVEDLDGALERSNATDYALVAGIYTRDGSAAHRYARMVDAGQVYINEFFAGGIALPFGGNRKSGFGRAKGLDGLMGYCRIKGVAARL